MLFLSHLYVLCTCSTHNAFHLGSDSREGTYSHPTSACVLIIEKQLNKSRAIIMFGGLKII